MKVDFYRHALTSADANSIADVIASPFLTTGRIAKAVEAQLQDYFSVPHALLTNSWTNGAIAVLLAMDLAPGDEIIVPAMTFIASANVVELVGARIVFADVDPATLLLTTDGLAKALSPRTRAVIPVHLYGQMCDIESMRALLAARTETARPVTIIEDCAHCFEGEYAGAKPGRYGDVAIFSFYATKNVTCGEGGAIITRDQDLADRIVQTRLHGMTAIAADRFAGGRYNHWDMMRLGTKANLPDLLAAVLPAQIASIDQRLDQRQQLADRYRRAFADGPVRLVEQLPHAKSAEHLFVLGIPQGKRDDAIKALNEDGIGVTVNFRSVTEASFYKARYPTASADCPHSVQWGNETLSLPLFPGLTPAEQDHVIRTVQTKIYPMLAETRPSQ